MEQVTTATVEAILKEEQARADELKAIAARIVTICDRFDDNLEDITLDLNANGFDPKEILRVVGSRAGAFDSNIRAEIDSLIGTSLDSFDGNDESSEWHVCHHLGSWIQYMDGQIILHTVMLPPAGDRSKYHATKNKYIPAAGYGHALANEINVLMSKVASIPTFVRSSFIHKLITIVFVYPKGRTFIPDNDRYDTKAAIDAITRWLPNGDEAVSCALSYHTLRTSRLEPGTYFIVAPNKDIGFVKNIYNAQCKYRKENHDNHDNI